MTEKNYDLIVFGGICCDIIMSGIKELPNPGEEIWANNMKMTVGGIFNVAAAAARLNLKTAIPCIIGQDILSTFIEKTAGEEGIETSLFLTEEGDYEQLSVVLNFGRDRSFISYAANHKMEALEIHMQSIADSIQTKTAVFGMTGSKIQYELMKKLKKAGSKILLDCSWDAEFLTSSMLLEQISMSDYFLPNLMEAQKITGQLDAKEAAMVLVQYTDNVIIKLGSQGVLFANKDQIKTYPAIDLGKALDTTGAGDNFIAGFCYGLVKDESIENCITFGQCCASKSVLTLGGFTSSLHESELSLILDELCDVYEE